MKTTLHFSLSVLVITVLLIAPINTNAAANAAANSPFLGHWRAIDIDGSDMGLMIGGPPNGPFQITWTDSYMSYCGGEAGIIRGTGLLNEGDPNLLEASLHVECFTTGEEMDIAMTFRYHPSTDKLSSRYDNGMVIIWQRPGQPQLSPPEMGLRVNYGHDWVESFYEAGHLVWITVTDSEGMEKATAIVFTEPKDFWEGETGFQTNPEDWDPASPDIQPYDWVYAWVDNGASAQVQIGDISGTIDLNADSIEGTIYASWFTNPVQVECLDWGSGQEPPLDSKDGGLVSTDGTDPYSCSWADEWDIQPEQDVGVGYFGPDGHWVANAFSAPNPRIVASEAGDWFWVTGFYPGMLDLYIYESADIDADLLWSGQQEALDLWGITSVTPDIHWQDLVPGNYVVVTDGVNQKGLVLETITMEIFDTGNEIMAGTAPAGRDVWAAAGPQDWQEGIMVKADSVTGAWLADFMTIGFDITEDMRPWSYAQIFDDDGDANEASAPPPPPNTRFTVWPEWSYLEGYEWPNGAVVSISVADKEECSTGAIAGYPEWDPSNTFFSVNFPEECTIEVGNLITLSFESLNLTHQVQDLTVTAVDEANDTVAGTAAFDPEQYLLHTWIHGMDESYMQLSAEGGTWLADFGSQGFDLQPGMGGRVELVDPASNATAVEWYIPNPHFTIFPEWEWYDGMDWPDGVKITVMLNDNTDCVAVHYSEGSFFNGGFPEGCDVAIGDLVSMTDGVTTRAHTVRNLGITGVDTEADIVSGTADVGAQVNVWLYATGETVQATADGEGNWQADFTGVFDLTPGECGRAEIPDEFGNATSVEWCAPVYPWRDEFEDELLESWYWINENSASWNLNENPGFLRIYASPGGTGEQNLLLRPVAEGDFMITTHLFFEPGTNFQFAGLVIYQDGDNFLQFGRAFCDSPDVCVGNGIYFDNFRDGSWADGNFATPVDSPSEAYLSLERRGDMVTAFFSYEGIDWIEIGAHWIPSEFQVTGVGLTASQDNNTPEWNIPADFDFFEVSEG
jgi:hypothetical protein